MDALLRRRAMFAAGGSPTPPTPSRLPDGYTELQYVSTDSRAWINTGVAGATDLEIGLDFLCTTFVANGAMYGNYNDESHRYNRVLFNNANHPDELLVAGGLNRAQRVSGMSLNTRHTVIITSTTAKLDGTTTAIASASATNNTDNIVLGNRGLNTVTRDLGLQIFSFWAKKNGTSVLDYVPAKRDSDDAVGFYDLINEEFVKSLTGSEFSAGPVA